MNSRRVVEVLCFIAAMGLLCVTIRMKAEQEGAAAYPDKVNANFLEALRWRSIGPSRGGRVPAVAGDPQNPLVFYFWHRGRRRMEDLRCRPLLAECFGSLLQDGIGGRDRHSSL